MTHFSKLLKQNLLNFSLLGSLSDNAIKSLVVCCSKLIPFIISFGLCNKLILCLLISSLHALVLNHITDEKIAELGIELNVKYAEIFMLQNIWTLLQNLLTSRYTFFYCTCTLIQKLTHDISEIKSIIHIFGP